MSQPSSSSSAQDLPSVDALRAVYADKKVGELFEFGRYPQGDDGEMKPITWRVLLRDADYLLVIAEQCLDCKPYNEELCDITWADCTLRRWLNDEFYDRAFNELERKYVLMTSVVNNTGPNTEDRVFLLSFDDAAYLFDDISDRYAKPTEFAIKNGANTDDYGMIPGYCCWWLRSRGYDDNLAYLVIPVDVDQYDLGCSLVHIDSHAVRPALKLAL